MQRGLLRATFTLLAGGALAQALPLLLGPWLTRLYSPAEFGQYAFVWTVATNIGVVACARFEFALPLERDEGAAAVLLGLCLRVLAGVLLACVVVAAVLARELPLAWTLPLAVLASSLTQLLMQWGTRAEVFQRLALARIVQYGGGAVLQVMLGTMAVGVFSASGAPSASGALGLMWGAVIAALLAALLLMAPAPQGGWAALWRQPRAGLREMARKHRDFPIYNTPHAFVGALQDSLALWLIATAIGDAQAGFWALALRYLKAPASLVGGALSQVLYPRLAQAGDVAQGRRVVLQAMGVLGAVAGVLMITLMAIGPWLFRTVFGAQWTEAGELARALAPYIAVHFVAAPLSVAPMAWKAQAWMLRLALVGQVMFIAGLAAGLHWGGLVGAAWGVSGMMVLYFGYFFAKLATWQVRGK